MAGAVWGKVGKKHPQAPQNYELREGGTPFEVENLLSVVRVGDGWAMP